MARDKHFLNGVISKVLVQELPAAIGPYVAYVRLSNVYAAQRILLSFCNAATDEELFGFETQSPDKADPLETHTLILRIPQFAVEEAGRYIFSASHNGVPFAQCPIQVINPPQPKELT